MSGGWGHLWDGDELAGAGGANLRPRAIATSTNKELVFSHSKDQMKICRLHLTHHKQMNECECLGVCVCVHSPHRPVMHGHSNNTNISTPVANESYYCNAFGLRTRKLLTDNSGM